MLGISLPIIFSYFGKCVTDRVHANVQKAFVLEVTTLICGSLNIFLLSNDGFLTASVLSAMIAALSKPDLGLPS